MVFADYSGTQLTDMLPLHVLEIAKFTAVFQWTFWVSFSRKIGSTTASCLTHWGLFTLPPDILLKLVGVVGWRCVEVRLQHQSEVITCTNKESNPDISVSRFASTQRAKDNLRSGCCLELDQHQTVAVVWSLVHRQAQT
jgi:hypothetical protein